MKKKERIHCKEGLHDPDRAAYMIAWRDRHIEKQNALIKGYEEELSLMEALLAFALWQGASEAQEGRVARIPKKAVRLASAFSKPSAKSKNLGAKLFISTLRLT